MHRRQAENLALDVARYGAVVRPVRVDDRHDWDFGWAIEYDRQVYKTAAAWRPVRDDIALNAPQYVDPECVRQIARDILDMPDPWKDSEPIVLPERVAELAARREALGMTQEQLAEALGVPRNTLARWERGELEVRHPDMLRLALERIEQTRTRVTTSELEERRRPLAPSEPGGEPWASDAQTDDSRTDSDNQQTHTAQETE